MLSKCINALILKLVMFRMLIIILINTYIETACMVLWNLLHIHLNLSTKETISEFRWALLTLCFIFTMSGLWHLALILIVWFP